MTAIMVQAPRDFLPYGAPGVDERSGRRLRWIAVSVALALHGGVFAALVPYVKHTPLIDPAPLVVMLLEPQPALEPQAPAAEAVPERIEKPVTRTVPPAPVPVARMTPPMPVEHQRPPEPVTPPQPAMPEPPPSAPPVAAAPTPAPNEAPPTPAAPAATTTAISTPSSGAPTVAAAAPSTAAAPAARPTNEGPPAGPIVPPRFDADYFQNEAPTYPPQSKRLGEEGKVVLVVQVSADGAPLSVSLKNSSGWPRLDQAALTAVRNWRFAPARIGDKAVVASVLIPLSFSLDD
jgi:periplasmic protein TonB